VSIIVLHLSAGCALNATPQIVPYLKPDLIDSKLDSEKIGPCRGTKRPEPTLAVNIVNAEKRLERYNIPSVRYYIIPTEFIHETAAYMRTKLEDMNVPTDEIIGRKILVSFEKADAYVDFTIIATIKIKIEIPEINHTRVYTGAEGSGIWQMANAYALHIAINKFLNDPVFRQYIRCQ
jgi:hypothetical protein